MTIEYTNRRKQKYYLHQGQTKTGKPKYFFSMKTEGTLVNTLPEGYEIYENPNAQVFLRKIPPQIITPEEIAIVRAGLKKHAKLIEHRDFMLDVKNKNIVVYLCDQNIDSLGRLTPAHAGFDAERFREALSYSLTYTPMMQFVLDDIEDRAFIIERWCFRGSIDDWITLDYSSDLKELVKKYGQHLGKESFYDLMPF
jgi:hypothetical protein